MAKAKILLVDDEVVFTDNMANLLSTRGYYVKSAYTGEMAIKLLEKELFDVIVLDLKMPGMDGITTLEKIKELGLFTETLILTGHGSIDTAREALKIGAYDYLTKPCEIEELEDKIKGAWDKKEQAEKKETQETVRKITKKYPG